MRTSLREFHSQPCTFPWLFTHFLLTCSCEVHSNDWSWFPEKYHGKVMSNTMYYNLICIYIYVYIHTGHQNKVKYTSNLLSMHCWRFLPVDSWSQHPDPIGWCFILLNVRNRISEGLVYLGEVPVRNSSQPEMYGLWREGSVTDQDI